MYHLEYFEALNWWHRKKYKDLLKEYLSVTYKLEDRKGRVLLIQIMVIKELTWA